MPEQKDVGGLVFLALDPQPPTIKNEGINIYNFPTNILLWLKPQKHFLIFKFFLIIKTIM